MVDRLIAEGKKAFSLDFPGYDRNVAGKLLYEALKLHIHGDFIAVAPKIASVVYAFDRMESAPQIREWLEAGATVILDRYVSSNQIHQGGKIADENKRVEFIDWLDLLEYGAAKLPKPDMVLYLDVPVEVSLKLIQKRAIDTNTTPDQAESNEKHLKESRDRTLAIINRYPSWKKIDCSSGGEIKSREEIHGLIYSEVIKHL